MSPNTGTSKFFVTSILVRLPGPQAYISMSPFSIYWNSLPRLTTAFCKVIAVGLLFVLIGFTASCERSESHILLINGPVHVYKTDVPPTTYPGTDFIAELGPSDHPAILEVQSKNGYRAVKIRLADGREGWVFSGESIEVR